MSETETLWLNTIRETLADGPKTTHTLAKACGITGRRYYHRWRKLLLLPESGVERVGMMAGPTGHQNIVWALR